MGAVSAPDPRVAPLLAPGQVVQVGLRATVMLRGGGGVAVPVIDAVRRSSREYVHRHEIALSVPDLGLVEARDAKQRAQWDALDFGDGHFVRVYQLFRVGHERVFATQGTYRVTGCPRQADGSWSLTGKSAEYVVQRADLLADESIRGSAVAAIARLIQSAVPGARLVIEDDVTDVVLAGMLCEAGQPGSRWAAVTRIAESCGWQVYCDLEGQFRVTVPPMVVGVPDWRIVAGESLVAFEGVTDDQDVCNVAVVTSQDGRRVGVAVDDRPGSPTFVGADVVAAAGTAGAIGLNAVPGTWGLYAQRFEMDGIESDAQAAEAARARLRGRRTQISVQSAWQPFAEPDDRVVIGPTGDVARLAVVTAVEVELGAASGGMKVEVRE